MSLGFRICYIKAYIKNNNISFKYFKECFEVLQNLIAIEYNQAALSFANTLKEAAVLLDSIGEQKEYFIYFNKINNIINELELKLSKKAIKIR